MSRVVLASFDRVPSPKGASAHILGNARALAPEHEVSLVTLGTEPAAKLRHRPLHLPEPNWLLRGLAFEERVRAVFAEYEFDVYHVRSPWEGLAVPVGADLIYEVNALYSIEVGYHFPAAAAKLELRRKLRARELCLLDRATRVITPSEVTAQHLIDLGADRDRVRVIPNAPSFEPIDEREPSADGARLCYVGTLAPWQGLAELLDVLPRIRRPFELRVIASGARRYRKLVDRICRKRDLSGRVHFDAPRPPAELGAWLAGQSIGLAPLIPCERNLIQGCNPIKILDYAAAGLAILAPDMPVVREILGPDYPLYRRWSRSHMIELLDALIASPALRDQLGGLGRSRIVERFGRDRQSQRLRALYRELGC